MAGFETIAKVNLNNQKVIKEYSSSYVKDSAELKVDFEVFTTGKKFYLKKKYSCNKDSDMKTYIGHEVWFLGELVKINHDSLPKRISFQSSINYCEMAFEYSGKSLFSLFEPLKKIDRNIKRENCYRFIPKLRVLIEGLINIHKIAPHGEICPSTILIKPKKILQFAPFVPKNIEFHLSKFFDKTETIAIPKLYKAPELQINSMSDSEALKKADIFSLGLCFMHILCPELNIYEIWKIVKQQNFEELANIVKFRELAWLLFNMLTILPENRITLENSLPIIDESYSKIFPNALNYENFYSNEVIARRIPKLLTVFKTFYSDIPYVFKYYHMATESIINCELSLKEKVERLVEKLGPEVEKFLPRSNYHTIVEGNLIMIYQFAGINLEKFLESNYNQEYTYSICYSIINLVILLYSVQHVHTELTLEALYFNQLTNSISCLKASKIVFTKDLKYKKNNSLKSYQCPIIQEKIRSQSPNFNTDTIENSLSYSLGILLLKIMYFPIRHQISSSSKPEESTKLYRYANSLFDPLKTIICSLLLPEENRLRLSSLESFMPKNPTN